MCHFHLHMQSIKTLTFDVVAKQLADVNINIPQGLKTLDEMKMAVFFVVMDKHPVAYLVYHLKKALDEVPKDNENYLSAIFLNEVGAQHTCTSTAHTNTKYHLNE